MNSNKILISNFDFRKRGCQVFDCNGKVKVKILFREFFLEEPKVRELASISLCEKHLDMVEGIRKEMNKGRKGSLVRIKKEKF